MSDDRPSITEITMSRIREEWESPLRAQIQELQSRLEWVSNALRLAIKQNSHDMLLTRDEIRRCEQSLGQTDEKGRPMTYWGGDVERQS